MNQIFSVHTTRFQQVPIRNEEVGGVAYSIVPVVMMVEGVHAGSEGPVLYTREALSEFSNAWNGSPIPIDHPMVNGIPVSCNSPEYRAKAIGAIYNTTFEDGKLKAEVWLETLKSQSILSMIQNGDIVEVSTGMFANNIPETGIFNGAQYIARATRITPDHLAILPNKKGACSAEAGCGIRVNEAGEKIKMTRKNLPKIEKEDCFIPVISEFTVNASINYVDLAERGRNFVDSLDYSTGMDNRVSHYIRSMDASSIVYMVKNNGRDIHYIKRPYEISNGIFQWAGPGEPVRENISYAPVTNEEKKGDSMDVKTCCIEQVNAFIANNSLGYVEADRVWMETLSEDAFKAVVKASEKVTANTKPEVKPEVKPAATLEQLLANATPELKESIEHGQAILRQEKANLIQGIKTNQANQFTDEELSGFHIGFLRKLAATTVPTTNYAVSGIVPPKVNAYVEPPLENVYDRKEIK